MADVSPTDIVNRALYLQGNKVKPVTGTFPDFDDSAAGIAAKWLYPEAVRTVGRLFEWDFARVTSALTPSGNTPPAPFTQEYLYPPEALQLWQIRPSSVTDPNYPIPTTWQRANAVVSGGQVAVIQTDVVGAVAIYNNNPRPSTWDPGYTDAVVRWLASAFAMALSGRPETQQNILNTATQMVQQAMGRDS